VISERRVDTDELESAKVLRKNGPQCVQANEGGEEMDRPVGSGVLSSVSTYLIYQDGGIGDSQPQNMPGTEWKV